MNHAWYEVWCDETLEIPYVLMLVPDEKTAEGVKILDLMEKNKVVYAAPNYEDAKIWLLEDEYTRVNGRMERDG
jgi:hypothetical protein